MRRTLVLVATVALLSGAALDAGAPAGAATRRPSVSAVRATSGTTAGGTRLTVTGLHFAHVRAVNFGSTHGTKVRVLSSSKLQVTSPAHVAGLVNVTVRTTAGTSALRRADHFQFIAPPTVTGVSPATGDAAGGTRVTVSGRGFTGVTAVRFGVAAGTGVKLLSSTKLQVTAPPHPSGTYDLHVVNRYGSSRATSVDRFHYATSFTTQASVGLDQTLPVTACGLRPGTSAKVDLDGSPLATVSVDSTGVARANIPISGGLVADGQHQLHLAGTDGSGAPVAFSAPVLVDSTAPTLSDVAVSTPDAHPGDTITLSAHITDEGGAQFAVMEVDAVPPTSAATPCPSAKSAAHLESGTVNDGIWSMSCVIPDTATAGTYQLAPWASDVAGNWGFFTDDPGTTFTISAAP